MEIPEPLNNLIETYVLHVFLASLALAYMWGKHRGRR